MFCEACLRKARTDSKKKINTATQKHHKFSQVVWAKKLYGVLLHDPRNLEDTCSACNVNHASMFLTHWNEEQFCKALKIEPRSKQARARRGLKL